jgi:hypothetical protein
VEGALVRLGKVFSALEVEVNAKIAISNTAYVK